MKQVKLATTTAPIKPTALQSSKTPVKSKPLVVHASGPGTLQGIKVKGKKMTYRRFP
jgi:hypothetical protein